MIRPRSLRLIAARNARRKVWATGKYSIRVGDVVIAGHNFHHPPTAPGTHISDTSEWRPL